MQFPVRLMDTAAVVSMAAVRVTLQTAIVMLSVIYSEIAVVMFQAIGRREVYLYITFHMYHYSATHLIYLPYIWYF